MVDKKGSSFFKSLLFEEEVAVKKEEDVKKEGIDALTKPKVSYAGDAKTKEKLLQALKEKETSTGFWKFKETLGELSSVIADEPTRFKTAGITAKALGILKPALLSLADKVLLSLESEKKEFNEIIKTQKEAKISINKTRISEIDAALTKLAELQTEKTNLLVKIAEDESKLVAVENSFNASYEEVKIELEGDKKKIESYML